MHKIGYSSKPENRFSISLFDIFLKKEFFFLLSCTIIGFILRFYFMQHREVIDYDGVYYAKLGQNLLSGNGYVEPEGIYQWYYPPFYPIQIGLMWLFLRDAEVAGEWVSMIYGTLLPILLFYVAKKLYGKKVAIVATVLSVLYISYIEFSSSATTEMTFTGLSVLAILVLHKALNTEKGIWYFGCGVLTALLYLTKPAGIQYLTSFTLAFIVIPVFRCKRWTCMLKSAPIFLIGFLILALPYFIFLKNHFGYWTPSGLMTRNLFRSILINNNENKWQDYQLTADGFHLKYITTEEYVGERVNIYNIIQDEPVKFIRNYIRNFKKETLSLVKISPFHLLTFVLIILGFYYNKGNQKNRQHDILLSFFLFPYFLYPLVSVETVRWLYPLMAILLIWCARGIISLDKRIFHKLPMIRLLRRNVRVRYPATIVFFLIMILSTGRTIKKDVKILEYYPNEHKVMGYWVRDNLPKSSVIMATSPHVSFYSGTKLFLTPWGTVPEILRYGKHHQVDYLIIDEAFTPEMRPLLTKLLDEEGVYQGLKLIHKIIGSNGRKILAYQLIEN